LDYALDNETSLPSDHDDNKKMGAIYERHFDTVHLLWLPPFVSACIIRLCAHSRLLP